MSRSMDLFRLSLPGRLHVIAPTVYTFRPRHTPLLNWKFVLEYRKYSLNDVGLINQCCHGPLFGSNVRIRGLPGRLNTFLNCVQVQTRHTHLLNLEFQSQGCHKSHSSVVRLTKQCCRGPLANVKRREKHTTGS